MTSKAQVSTSLVLIAAENGNLSGGKEGGEADVVRDVSLILAEHGHKVVVIIPDHNALALAPGSRLLHQYQLSDHGETRVVDCYEVRGTRTHPNLQNIVLRAAAFQHPGGTIYVNDPVDRPFASDASKYAPFCAAVVAILKSELFGPIDIIHLHDWHAAFARMLVEVDPEAQRLRRCRWVLTIHNLAMQGIRPHANHESSWCQWFPHRAAIPGLFRDPRWPDCINPLAYCITAVDAVHVVSRGYAEEVLLPNRVDCGFRGGEGLEGLLQQANREGRLHGIPNGLIYSEKAKAIGVLEGLKELRCELSVRISQTRDQSALCRLMLPYCRLVEFLNYRKFSAPVLTMVARMTEQKVALFKQATSAGVSALASILAQLPNDGLFLVLGKGEAEYEDFIRSQSLKDPRLVFINEHSPTMADLIYSIGEIYCMPSLWEPGGLSNLLANYYGRQLVIANRCGGLRDSVIANKTGFLFNGATLVEKADSFVGTVCEALRLRAESPETWEKLRRTASAARFTWNEPIHEYERTLYGMAGRD